MHDRLEAEYGDTGILRIIKILFGHLRNSKKKREIENLDAVFQFLVDDAI